MDRFNAMQLYCCIVETGKLTLAADQLNLSKGAVSKQLAKLEEQLRRSLTQPHYAPSHARCIASWTGEDHSAAVASKIHRH